MGQEILYCSRCQVRIVGGDFDKGEAYRVGEQVACQKCAMDMLAKSPVAIQQQIHDQKQRALDKKMPSRGPTGSSTATRAPRETAPSKVPVAAMIGIGVTLVILVGMLAMSGSPPPPAPPPPPPPKVANTGPTPQETALAQAKRELEATEKKRKEQDEDAHANLLQRAGLGPRPGSATGDEHSTPNRIGSASRRGHACSTRRSSTTIRIRRTR